MTDSKIEGEAVVDTALHVEEGTLTGLFGVEISATKSHVSRNDSAEVVAAGGQRIRSMPTPVHVKEKLDVFRVLYCKRSLKKHKSYA